MSKGKGRKAKRPRSIWDSKDDWDTLVAESQLSTASISRRKPPPAGLKGLKSYCAEVAGRAFKAFWELDEGVSWRYAWDGVPDDHKILVRDEVFRYWGSYLTPPMISDVFISPPEVILPGNLLPVVATAERLIPYRPKTGTSYTKLSLKHAPKASDVAIAGLIHSMPNLEEINLKGCTLAGARTVDIICKKCKSLKRLNVKGTNVNEQGMREILDLYGKQLEVFKIDRVLIESPDETFIHDSYPNIRKLCLPGDMLSPGAAEFRKRAARSGYRLPHPTARPTPPGARMTWDNFGKFFPALTHLSLPQLLVPNDTIIELPKASLVKIDLGGSRGPPVPALTLAYMIDAQTTSLQHLAFGIISTQKDRDPLGLMIGKCEKLRVLDVQVPPEFFGSEEFYAGLWRYMSVTPPETLVYMSGLQTLKRLTLKLSIDLEPADHVLSVGSYEGGKRAPIEELRISARRVQDPFSLALDLADCHSLRILDVAGIGFSDEDIFTILDGNPNLHTIDLTSCRGVKVQNRRNIFKAWEESRAPPPLVSVDVDEGSGRGKRRRVTKK